MVIAVTFNMMNVSYSAGVSVYMATKVGSGQYSEGKRGSAGGFKASYMPTKSRFLERSLCPRRQM